MGKVRILADTTCDLTDDLLKEYEITLIPLNVLLGDESYYDREEITPKELFAWAEKNHQTPKTAAPGIEKAVAMMRPFAEAGEELIFFGISEEMSTTCNVIRLAAEELNYSDHISVIDSMNLSTGIGLQVIRAAVLARDGKTREEITKTMEGLRDKVRASFVVDTMEYLAMGGRCSQVKAIFATALKLKPMIVVENGKMGVGRKYRGATDKALLKYVEDLTPELMNAVPTRVFITHSSANPETVKKVREYLESLHYFMEIHETIAGGTISSHCGPGTLGVLFYAK